jgi:hypothetical protein
MKKPTEEELQAFMEAYAEVWSTRQKIPPPTIDWGREAIELLDYYEGCAKPNGDWQTKSGVRISSWERTAQRSVRRSVDRYIARSRSGPVSTHQEVDRPVNQTSEAPSEAIRKYFPNWKGEA